MNRVLAFLIVVVVALVALGGQFHEASRSERREFGGKLEPPVTSEPERLAPVGHRTHPRSREVTREFEREHPCPSTGRRTGACPGYVKDHVVALCDGGADAVSNLQWQSVKDGKAKDKTECRSAFARRGVK